MLTTLDISGIFRHFSQKTMLHFVNPFTQEDVDEPSYLTDPISSELEKWGLSFCGYHFKRRLARLQYSVHRRGSGGLIDIPP